MAHITTPKNNIKNPKNKIEKYNNTGKIILGEKREQESVNKWTRIYQSHANNNPLYPLYAGHRKYSQYFLYTASSNKIFSTESPTEQCMAKPAHL